MSGIFTLAPDGRWIGSLRPDGSTVGFLCSSDVRPTLGNDGIGRATQVEPSRSRHGALMTDTESTPANSRPADEHGDRTHSSLSDWHRPSRQAAKSPRGETEGCHNESGFSVMPTLAAQIPSASALRWAVGAKAS